MRDKGEEGQAIVLVAVAMSIFLLGAVGLAIDGSHLYSQRQMAQAAADSAAIGGIMSVFHGTNTSGAAAFSTGSSFTCSTTDARTPCAYAATNAFGTTSKDTVTIDFPTSAPGVALSGSFAVNLVRATVQRKVDTTLMRMLSPTSFTTVTATATAAIVDILAPIPIIVLHPTLNDAFQLQGNPAITICGGPSKSIQVNSVNQTEASHLAGSATVDLSHAGPKDTLGDCTLGTGADFGVYGKPATPPAGKVSLGTSGHYIQPASPILDPLSTVPPPPVPATAAAQVSLSAGSGICPSSAGPHGCTVLSPGLYASGLSLSNTTVLMKPGIYYMQGTTGFECAANCNLTTITGFVDGAGGTNTGWDGTTAGGGVLVYNSGSGPVNVGSNGSVYMVGSKSDSTYKGILFFESRTAPANVSPPIKNANSLGGGGAMTLIGTLYFTNTLATTTATPSHYQELRISGNSGSGTLIQGEIIADSLTLGGGGTITMNLNPAATLFVPQVALVQ